MYKRYSRIRNAQVEEGTEQYWHIIGIRYAEKGNGIPRSVVMQALRAEGIPLFPDISDSITKILLFFVKLHTAKVDAHLLAVIIEEMLHIIGVCVL